MNDTTIKNAQAAKNDAAAKSDVSARKSSDAATSSAGSGRQHSTVFSFDESSTFSLADLSTQVLNAAKRAREVAGNQEKVKRDLLDAIEILSQLS